MELFLMCIKIFFARICDVSLGTVRIIAISKGKKLLTFCVGFVEVGVWFLVARDALNTTNPSLWIPFAYAAGYAVGTFCGGTISDKFIKGNLGVQVVLSGHDPKVIAEIRKEGYAVSVMDIKGIDEEKTMLFIGIDKNSFKHLNKLIKNLDPKAFLTVNETKYVQNGFVK